MPLKTEPHAVSERIYIGAGSNLGDRLANINAARGLLAPAVTVLRVSPVYETDPWGYADQPRFLNAVFEAETSLEPPELLAFLKKIEREVGRKPTFHYGPRVVDLDILFYGMRVIRAENLTVPHALIAERIFVLVPLADLAPKMQHPITGKTISEMLSTLPREGIHLFQTKE
jgi:2-amino-4-hydroxy-6-hydroxymethyldihydropteridine diphosphokinase